MTVPVVARGVSGVLEYLAARAVSGVEAWDGHVYRRCVGGAVMSIARDGAVAWDGPPVPGVAERLLDAGFDQAAVEATLAGDPLIGPLVRAAPWRRAPGAVDGFEIAVRAVVGQQVSVAGARTILGRLAAAHGERLAAPVAGVSHRFPSPAALAAVDPSSLPMPRARGRALVGLAAAVAAGDVALAPGEDPVEARARLLALPGIGPWTAEYVALRALGDRDAFPASDLGVRRALERLGADGSPRSAAALAERWRPLRAYALHHLWATL